MRCLRIFVVVLFTQCVATMAEDGQLLGGLGGGGGLLGGLGALGNVGNTLTGLTGGLSNLNTVTNSLNSVTSVASTLVENVTKTVAHLTAVTSQVTQLAGTISKLTTTATGLPATVLKFTNTITSAFTTVTQVVSEASGVLGQGTKLIEAITNVQTSTQALVKQLTSSTINETIIKKSVTTVVTSIQYFITVAQGYIGGASKLLNSSSILPISTAVGKVLVSMQSVLEIVSSTITTVQTVTKITSTTTIIETTLQKVRGFVRSFTNQISDPSLIPNLLQNLPGFSSEFPAETQTKIVPGEAGAGIPTDIPNEIVNGSNNGANGQNYPLNSQEPGNLNGPHISYGPGYETPIQPPNLGSYIGPNNINGERLLSNPPLNSPSAIPNVYPAFTAPDSSLNEPNPPQGENPISNWAAQTNPDNDLQHHSFWNYPVDLAQPDNQVDPQYQFTNIGNRRPSQEGYWEGPSGGHQNSGTQINTINVPYQPVEQFVIRPDENLEEPINENDQTYRSPNNYPDYYLQSPEWQQSLPPSHQTFLNLATPQNTGPDSGNYQYPSQSSENYPSIDQSPYPDLENFDNSYPAQPTLSGSYPNYPLTAPPIISTSGPVYTNPLSGNYPSIAQPSYLVPENSGSSFPEPSESSETYPIYPINSPPLPIISTVNPAYTIPITEHDLFPSQSFENYPSIGQSSYPVLENLGTSYPVPSSVSGNYPNYPIIAPSLPSPTFNPVYTLPIGPGYPTLPATIPVSVATTSASASPGYATASAAATISNIGGTPSFSGPGTSINVFRKYEIALREIFEKIQLIIASVQGVPTDQLTFAVRRIYATTHTLMLFVSQLSGSSARSQNSVDIIFNIINELSGNLQDLVRLVQQIFAIQGNSIPLLTVIKLTSAVTALTINQVQKLAQQIDTNATNFGLQSSIDHVLLSLINVYGQLYPGSYTGQIDQPNGVDNLFNNLSTSNQSYKPIYHGISHSSIQVIKNIIQQSAQTIQITESDYNRLLRTLQALPLNQDQINQITNLMSQMNNNLNTVNYRLESIDQILNRISDYGHVGNFDQYITVSKSISRSSASSTSGPDGTDASAASASSSSSTVTAPYSQVVQYAGPLAQNILQYSGSPLLSS